MDDAFTAAAIEVLNELEPGEVVSYGEVAEQAGFPGAARAVGNLLKHTEGLPWWRVVNASGRLVPGGEAKQAKLLRAEGVEVKNGRVVSGSRAHASPPGGGSPGEPGGGR